MGPYINIMQQFKQSDDDIQIWMAENDNIMGKVRFSDVSTYVKCFKRKSWNVVNREA